MWPLQKTWFSPGWLKTIATPTNSWNVVSIIIRWYPWTPLKIQNASHSHSNFLMVNIPWSSLICPMFDAPINCKLGLSRFNVSSHKLPVNPMFDARRSQWNPMKSLGFFQVFSHPKLPREGYVKDVAGLVVAYALTAGSFAVGSVSGGAWEKSWSSVGKIMGRWENHGKSLWKPSEARKIGAFLTKIQWSVIISPLSPQNHTKMTKNKVLDTSKPGNVGQLSDLNGWFYRWEKDIALWLMDCSSATFDYRRILGDIVGISWEHILFNTSQHFWCGTPVS